MKKASWIFLIAGLLALTAYFFLRQRRPAEQAGAALPAAETPGPALSAAASNAPASRRYATNVIPFHYSRVASDDLKLYVKNLRSVSCPEQTIRDIISAIVRRKYAPAMEALREKPSSREYWKRASGAPAPDPARQQEIARLQGEQKKLLLELLGSPAEPAPALDFGDPVPFVSEEKKQALAAAQKEITTKILALRNDMMSKGVFIFNERIQREIKQLEDQRMIEAAKLLSPEELRQYELNWSPLADELRSSLDGFSPSEAEFTAIFNARKQHEDFHNADPAEKAEWKEQLQAALGPDRFAAYERAQDEDFKELMRVAERYSLPEGSSEALYAARKEAEEKRRAILAQENASAAERKAQLAALEAETRARMKDMMGEGPFKGYLRRGASPWFTHLKRANF